MEDPEAKNDVKTEKPKALKSGGGGGFFKRLWYYLKFVMIGVKWNLIELFTFHKKFDLKKVPRRPGEVVVITGGARGIGLEVIRKLLILDMHVIIGCRNWGSGQEMVESFRREGINTGSTEVINLDLMSLESVRDFGNAVLAKCSKIHVLINNAGIMAVPYQVTKDDYESQFQVNYLSHFLLTNMLLPKLIKTGRPGKTSRIVNVSSVAQYGGTINFEDINMQQMYSPGMAYMASKLMQVVTTRDLDSRLAKEGVHLKVYAVHPGVVKTDLYNSICIAKAFGFLLKLIYKTPEQGADGVLFAAISSKFEGEGGLFFANCKKNSVNKEAKDIAIQKRLWDLSCKLTQWEDIPITELVKQNIASRGTRPKPSAKNEVRILTEVSKVTKPVAHARKSETESIKNALEPLKFIDDLELEDIEELEAPDLPAPAIPTIQISRSSSSSESSNPRSFKSIFQNDPDDLQRSSISSKSSTTTVIAEVPDFEEIETPISGDDGLEVNDAAVGDRKHTLTGPERDLLLEIGIIPPESEVQEPVSREKNSSDITDKLSSRDDRMSLTSLKSLESMKSLELNSDDVILEVQATPVSQNDDDQAVVSISNGHESTSSSFVYESS